MKSVIILLAIALVIRAEIDVIIKREAAVIYALEELAPKENTPEADKYENIMQALRQARATETYVGWVDANLNECQSLSANLSSWCGITYQAPGIVVSRFDPVLTSIVKAIDDNSILTANCKLKIRAVLCYGFFPQCSSDASTATYSNITTACSNITTVCRTSNVININGITAANLCSNSGQTINLKSCTRFTSNIPDVNQSRCGPLPANITFPFLSISDLARNRVNAGSLNQLFSSRGVTFECAYQWYKFICTRAPYCSPDQSKVLTAVTKQQCESALKCLPASLKLTFGTIYPCSSYPDKDSLTMCVNPSQGFPQADTGVTCATTAYSTAPTTVAHTTASNMTMTTNRASVISIGSTLFYLVCMLLASFQ